MKIVVTGSSGPVGRAIYERLARLHRVVGVDRRPSPTADVVCDLADTAAIRSALVGADAVVHTAALHAPHVGREPDAEFRRINVEGTRLLAGQAIAVGVSRFVYTSTTSLYGVLAPPGTAPAAWIDEHTVPRPRTIYHETKLQAEQLLQRYGQAGAMIVTILRMSRCFAEPAPDMAVHRLHRGIDARDVATAHERAIETFNSLGARTYLISAATPFLPQDCADLGRDAGRVLQRRAPALVAAFASRGWPLPATLDRVYDSRQAQRDLRWKPEFGFEHILTKDAAVLDEPRPANES
jgi:UDP-glucose 4-epimerase